MILQRNGVGGRREWGRERLLGVEMLWLPCMANSKSTSKDCILEPKGSATVVVHGQGCLSAGTKNDTVRGIFALLLQIIYERCIQFYCLQQLSQARTVPCGTTLV